MDAGKSGSLMALLAPLVMSFLGKQKRSMGLDALKESVDAVKNIDAGLPKIPTADGVTSQLTGVFDGYKETLGNVTDEASAQAALPQSEKHNENLGGMSDLLGQLPERARGIVGDKVKDMLGPLQGIIDRLYAIPGVKAILDPVLSSMVEKAKGLIAEA